MENNTDNISNTANINIYDFQVNDKVYDLMFGNGTVTKICIDKNTDNKYETIRVKFDKADKDACFWYSLYGYLENIIGSQTDFDVIDEMSTPHRTLFHGHDIIKKVSGTEDGLRYTIKESATVRYLWTNIYAPKIDESKRCPSSSFTGKSWPTKEKAMEACNTEFSGVIWIDTIQLKPGDPINVK